MKSTQEEKIVSAITDLIDNVERFFDVAPLRFLDLDGGNDDIACFTFLAEYEPEYETQFNYFDSWFQHLLETLDPFHCEDQERAKAAEKIIEAVLQKDDKVKHAFDELQTRLSGLQLAAQRIGFYVGVFIGARRQGATHSHLVEIGKALVMPCLRRWEIAKSLAEYDKKKARKRRRRRKSIRQRRPSPPSSRICESRR
jgi:hypothetical protein